MLNADRASIFTVSLDKKSLQLMIAEGAKVSVSALGSIFEIYFEMDVECTHCVIITQSEPAASYSVVRSVDRPSVGRPADTHNPDSLADSLSPPLSFTL